MKQREIKFRAWILTKKEEWTGVDNFDTFDWDNRMREISSIHFPLNNHSGKGINCISICENDNYANGWYAVGEKYNEAILMQYTGLKDINLKEIYENDIVLDEGGFKLIIVYLVNHQLEIGQNECDGEIYYSYITGYFGKFIDGSGYIALDGKLEKIGDIYQNPDLLK